MARILLVERVPFMKNIAHFALECGGHEVVGNAEDGEQTVEFYKVLHPDLVLLSIILPKMNGMDTLIRLKKIDPDSKVIICSTIRQERTIDQAKFHGADSYIIKPFQITSFLMEVNRVLGIEEDTAHNMTGSSLIAQREELEKVAARVLTKTISSEELQAFIRKLKRNS